MPTLLGLTTRRRPTSRSNGMWVCPQTTVAASTPSSTAAQRSGGLSTSTISSSRRGDAWQNRTGPSPAESRGPGRGPPVQPVPVLAADQGRGPDRLGGERAGNLPAVERGDHLPLA